MIIISIIAAIVMIFAILAQNPKGGGLSSQFGGTSSSQIMGVKKTGDLLEKITWGCMIIILCSSIVSSLMKPEIQTGFNSPNVNNANVQTPPAQAITPPPSVDNLGLTDDSTATTPEAN